MKFNYEKQIGILEQKLGFAEQSLKDQEVHIQQIKQSYETTINTLE